MALRLLTTILHALWRRLFSRLPAGGEQTGKRTADTPFARELRLWEAQVDGWLAPLATDPSCREQLAFLRRLLRHTATEPLDTVAVSARALYHVFCEGPAAGDLDFFVERIIQTSEPQEIAPNRDLITSLARLYGEEAPARVLSLLEARLTQREAERLATMLGRDTTTGQEVSIRVVPQ